MSRAQPPRRGVDDDRRAWATRLRAWTLGLGKNARARRGARRALEAAAARLYRDLVAAARAPGFFRELGVPDTPEGRFEMIGLHAGLVLRRLRAEGEAGQALGQALFDVMMTDLDQSLRELGVGDLGVGRQVKRMAGQFYARLRALEDWRGGAAARLEPVLRANVWQGGPPPGAAQVEALADYLVRSAGRLGAQSGTALLRGEAAFAALDGPPDRQAH